MNLRRRMGVWRRPATLPAAGARTAPPLAPPPRADGAARACR